MNTNNQNSFQRIAVRVSIVTLVVNIILALYKFIAGVVANSGAMISDAIHSASDVFSTIIVMIGVVISGKESDSDHPYGHERLECAASIILATILAIVGLGIGKTGVEKVINGNYSELSIPGTMALVAAIISIVVKEAMFWYTRFYAKKINSGALMADAWHHRSDALSSVGAFAGILGAKMGFAVLDPIASIVICIFIEKAAIDIFRDAMDKMVDKACPDEIVQDMKKIISEQEGVCGIDDIKTRLFGTRIYVDVEISADGSISLNDAHEIAENVHDAIEDSFENVKHCMVHVNPYISSDTDE